MKTSKLISKFMGLSSTTCFEDMNALMLVVEKIESLSVNGYVQTSCGQKEPVEFSFVVEIIYHQCMIHREVLPQYYGTEKDFLKLYDCRNRSKSAALILAIETFIRWYNRQMRLKCNAKGD